MPEDMGERTEDPTPKRRTDARQDGNIPRSQELSGALMMLAGTLMLTVAFFPMLGQFKGVIGAVLSGDTLGNPVDPSEAKTVIDYVAVAAARTGTPLLLIMAAAAFVIQFAQVGWLFSPKMLRPKLSHLNPLSGVKRLVGLSGLFRAGLSIVKLALVLIVVVLTIYQYRRQIVVLPYLAPLQIVLRATGMALNLALRLIAILLLLGLVDLVYQKWKHTQDLKMTKQQVKDEMRQAEGDPHVKRRRYRMQQQIAMQRIAAAVPRADVVVTNPEHVSVAITYEAERMHAPTVVAKGADFVALRIRQIALTNGIPIVQRPPLARALYRQVAVGQEIPPDFYHAVAEILAYVYQLNGKMAG
ncbi:MAG: flagellar biosynthesis protein FlhB [Planctomycetota bacterium]|jgi:flagellar biosynthetic protein FlhB